MPIHPTAIVHRGAEIDATADIGPFCVIGPRVKIGPHTRLISHVVVDNHTTLGARNVVHPFASLGGNPQDLKFKGEPARLLVGNDNVIRESATLNIGTEGGHMQTTLGDGCLLMAYAHIAHDCRVGNGVVLANAVSLAGHVDIGHHAILGGLAAVHQFTRIGRMAFIGGGAMVAQDVLPFCIAQGDRAQIAGVNVVGLKRSGWSRDRIAAVRRAVKALFAPDQARQAALEAVETEQAPHAPEIAELCQFVRSAQRGVCSMRRGLGGSDADEL
ncbi:MAG TPA: acyl-ACP--UDP-N-acetylglucosamine O-acyltransferase [Myxococcota bacterium]|nr:acyl-ACP--UDP-N-acetylglucosamine O-acyltransferase [Myxococcota bacterium]